LFSPDPTDKHPIYLGCGGKIANKEAQMRVSGFHIWKKLGGFHLMFILIMVSTIPVQADNLFDNTPPAFSDGKWIANFSIHAIAPTAATTLNVSYIGSMGFNSSGGMLDGEWLMTGDGTYAGDISGTATISAGGKVAGSSAEPMVSASKFLINLDITVSGLHVSTPVDLGSGGQLGLILTNATCNQVTADIAAPAIANYQSAGINAAVAGSYTAFHVGDLSASSEADYTNEVGDLIDEAEIFKQGVLSQNGVNYDKLNELISKAENLNLGLKKNIDCNFGGNKKYLTIITDVITDIVNFALQNPQLFTTEELSRLVSAAIGVGAMGSGAANPQQAAELKAKFIQEFSDRLNDAQTNKNCQDAVQIQVTSWSLGDANLKQQAKSVIDAIC
jgi:hypothetical protein